MLRKPQEYKDDNIRDDPKSKDVSALANSIKPLVMHKELEIFLLA